MFPPLNSPALDSRLQSIRRTTVAFASLFKDIPYIKYDDNDVEVEHYKVPIIYSNKEKYMKRVEAEPNEVQQKVQITLPRIEYGLLEIEYDSSRKLNQANKITGCSSSGAAFVNSPVPYNFIFELTLYTRNIEEANQIIEYILPFFSPDYNVKVNMVPELGITKSVPITFTGETEEEDSTGISDSAVRSVFRTLNFTARSYIYQTPKYYKPILEADTNIYVINEKLSYTITANSGIFSSDDIVYQGQAYDRAYAAAKIIDYNTVTKIITLEPIFGYFVSNTTIKNIQGSANAVISGSPNYLAISSIITPTPNTYPVIGPYNYNITLTDNTV